MKKHYYHQEILDICYKNHYSVDIIYQKIKEKFPKAGKSSIYRSVAELTKQDLLKKVKTQGEKAYYEKNIGWHAHLIDENTGNISDIPLSDISFLHLPHSFDVSDVCISVFGKEKI